MGESPTMVKQRSQPLPGTTKFNENKEPAFGVPSWYELYWTWLGYYDYQVVEKGLDVALNIRFINPQYTVKSLSRDDKLDESVKALVFNAKNQYVKKVKHWWCAAQCPVTQKWYELDSKCARECPQPILISDETQATTAQQVVDYMRNKSEWPVENF